MIDELLLLSGNDIPFISANLTIHQPRIKEIAYITQQKFWYGCEFLRFNKDSLNDEDKVNLSNKTNFNIIMTMIHGKSLEFQQARTNVLSILTLLFPTSKIKLGRESIIIEDQQTKELHMITDENFEQFKKILIKIFCLTSQGDTQYNPEGDLAKKIAKKIAEGQQKRAKLASKDDQKIAILSRYISILAVGLGKDLNDLMNYTVYQLMDEFNRFKLKLDYESFVQWKIAGATGLQDPQDWFKDIHQ